MNCSVKDIHERLAVGLNNKCQFCSNAATVLISNCKDEPVFWMCDEHALHFAEGIVKDVDGSTDIEVVSQSVEKQEKRKKTQRAGEKQALHV